MSSPQKYAWKVKFDEARKAGAPSYEFVVVSDNISGALQAACTRYQRERYLHKGPVSILEIVPLISHVMRGDRIDVVDFKVV